MSLLESTDEKTASPLQPNGGENRQDNRRADADRHISLSLAHELNNLLTVVQGHADRLFVKHQEDTLLAPSLKKISEAAHRAAELVRNAPKLELNPPGIIVAAVYDRRQLRHVPEISAVTDRRYRFYR